MTTTANPFGFVDAPEAAPHPAAGGDPFGFQDAPNDAPDPSRDNYVAAKWAKDVGTTMMQQGNHDRIRQTLGLSQETPIIPQTAAEYVRRTSDPELVAKHMGGYAKEYYDKLALAHASPQVQSQLAAQPNVPVWRGLLDIAPGGATDLVAGSAAGGANLILGGGRSAWDKLFGPSQEGAPVYGGNPFTIPQQASNIATSNVLRNVHEAFPMSSAAEQGFTGPQGGAAQGFEGILERGGRMATQAVLMGGPAGTAGLSGEALAAAKLNNVAQVSTLLGTSGLQGFNATYQSVEQQLIQQGVPEEQAHTQAMTAGVVNGLIDAALMKAGPLGHVNVRAPGARALIANAMNISMQQAGLGGLQAFANQTVEKIATGKQYDWKQIGAQATDMAVMGLAHGLRTPVQGQPAAGNAAPVAPQGEVAPHVVQLAKELGIKPEEAQQLAPKIEEMIQQGIPNEQIAKAIHENVPGAEEDNADMPPEGAVVTPKGAAPEPPTEAAAAPEEAPQAPSKYPFLEGKLAEASAGGGMTGELVDRVVGEALGVKGQGTLDTWRKTLQQQGVLTKNEEGLYELATRPTPKEAPQAPAEVTKEAAPAGVVEATPPVGTAKVEPATEDLVRQAKESDELLARAQRITEGKTAGPISDEEYNKTIEQLKAEKARIESEPPKPPAPERPKTEPAPPEKTEEVTKKIDDLISKLGEPKPLEEGVEVGELPKAEGPSIIRRLADANESIAKGKLAPLKNSKPEDTAALETLRVALNTTFSDSRPDGGWSVKQAAAATPIQKAAELIAKRFGGDKVVFFDSDNPSAGGGKIKQAPGYMFVNTKATSPILHVVGHELVHTLSHNGSEFYGKLLDAVHEFDPGAITQAAERYHSRALQSFESGASSAERMRSLNDPGQLTEEGLAEVVGESFTKREFWEQLSRNDPTFFATVRKAVVEFIRRMQEAFTGITNIKQPDVITKIADVLSEIPSPEEPQQAGEVIPVRAVRAKPIEINEANQTLGIQPNSAEAADFFNRAMKDDLTPEERKQTGLNETGEIRKNKMQAYRAGLLEDLQNGDPDATAKLAGTFVGMLKADAKRLIYAKGDTPSPENMADMVQEGMRALVQQISGDRRRPTGMPENLWRDEVGKNPHRINAYDPQTDGTIADYLYRPMRSAMEKLAFPTVSKEVGESGQVEQRNIAVPTEGIPVDVKGQEVLAGREPPAWEAAIANEAVRDAELHDSDMIEGKAPADLNATLKSRGAEIESLKDDRAIVRLKPTGIPVEPSNKPDAANLVRLGDKQLEVYRDGGDWYARLYGDEGIYQRVQKKETVGQLEKAAKEGALLPSAADIGKIVDTITGGTIEEPGTMTLGGINFALNKIGPGPDPGQVRVLLKKAQAEPIGAKTIGRPELANPADTEPARRLLDVIDEFRKQAGKPDVKPDLITKGAAEYLATSQRSEVVKELIDAAAKGTPLNDVKSLAASRIVAQDAVAAIKSGSDADIARVVQIANAYRDVRANTARALRIARDPLKTPAERAKEFLFNQMTEPTKQQEKILSDPNATKGQKDAVVADQVRLLNQLKDKLKGLGLNLDTMTDEELGKYDISLKLIRAVSEAKSTPWDAAHEWWVNSILSAPTTQVANLMGNTASTGLEYTVQRTTESLLNTFIGNKDSPQLGELPHIWGAVGPAIGKAARMFMRSMATEGPVFQDEFGGSGQADYSQQMMGKYAIPGKLGQAVRFPSRVLRAVDEFYKSMNANIEVAGQAYRVAKGKGLSGDALAKEMKDQVGNLDSEAWDAARKQALETAFKDEVGPIAKQAMQLRRNVPGARYVLPFIITPANIISMGMRKSPLGIFRMGAKLAEQGFIAMKPGDKEWTYSVPEGIHDAAEQALAWGATFALHGLVHGGLLTGNQGPVGQESDAERQFRMKNSPPMSIKIGGSWYSYERIEPIATALSVAVDALSAWDKAEKGKRPDLAAGEMIDKMTSVVADKTFLKGIGDLMKVVENPTDELPRMLSDFGVSWVPNIVRSAVRAEDPEVRDTKITSNGINWIKELGRVTGYKAGLAGIAPESFSMPPKVDLWGRPISKGAGGMSTDFLYRLTIPIREQRTADQTAADRVILNWNNQHPDDGFFPSPPPRQLERGNEFMTSKQERQLFIPKDQYEKFSETAGKLAYDMVKGVQFSNVEQPTKIDIEIIKRIIAASRSAATKMTFGPSAMTVEQSKEFSQQGVAP